MSQRLSTEHHSEVTLEEVTMVVGDAIAEARRLGIAASVAVCGGQSRLIAFSKMDGAGCMTARGAIGKAMASAVSGEPSEVIPPPVDDLYRSVVEGEGTTAFHQHGGITLRRAGALVGDIGMSGEASREQDLACATAAGTMAGLAGGNPVARRLSVSH